MTTLPSAAAEPLAAHSAVTAIPFFIPTFVVVSVIAVIIWRDRRTLDDAPATPDEDHSGEGGDRGPHTPSVG
ncbi:hypothetical protein [Actinomadura oligospora]|uniref:hypothetical protein n=1 Tax=Actinomadura oligospora TaxID=111804 RepID=UPI00047D1659|nr:hypothetical protein [Actinomadura oligospora]